MTHEPVIAYRCLMCGWIYEDDGGQSSCPKCKSEQRRVVVAVPDEDECSGKERY